MAPKSIAEYTKFMRVTIMFSAGCLGLVSTASAQSDVLIEACNAVKNSAKRLECLKSARTARVPDKKDLLPPAAVKPVDPPPFSLEVAAASCEAFLTGLAKRRPEAIEDVSQSTAEVMSVMWPGVDSKPATYCVVERQTRKIVSVTMGGRTVDGAMVNRLMAGLEATKKQAKEFAAGDYTNFVARAKAALTQAFKDPSSAQYKSLFISGDKMPVLCGEVNAKNSYGAYVGFRKFYASGEPSLNAVEPTSEKAVADRYVFDKMWPSMCGERKVDIDS